MAKLITGVFLVLKEITPSIIANEYGDVRSMLDQYFRYPNSNELAGMLMHLKYQVKGATFDYSYNHGWGYVEHES